MIVYHLRRVRFPSGPPVTQGGASTYGRRVEVPPDYGSVVQREDVAMALRERRFDSGRVHERERSPMGRCSVRTRAMSVRLRSFPLRASAPPRGRAGARTGRRTWARSPGDLDVERCARPFALASMVALVLGMDEFRVRFPARAPCSGIARLAVQPPLKRKVDGFDSLSPIHGRVAKWPQGSELQPPHSRVRFPPRPPHVGR